MHRMSRINIPTQFQKTGIGNRLSTLSSSSAHWVLRQRRIDAGVVFIASIKINTKNRTQTSVHSLFSHFYFNLLFIYLCLRFLFSFFPSSSLRSPLCRIPNVFMAVCVSDLVRLSIFIDEFLLLCLSQRFIYCHYYYDYHYLCMKSTESGGHCALEAHGDRVAVSLSTKVWIVQQHRRREYLFCCVIIIAMPMILFHSIGPTTSINILASPPADIKGSRLGFLRSSIFHWNRTSMPEWTVGTCETVSVCLRDAGALLVPLFQLNFGQKENLWENNNNNHIAWCGVKQSKFWTLFQLVCVAASQQMKYQWYFMQSNDNGERCCWKRISNKQKHLPGTRREREEERNKEDGKKQYLQARRGTRLQDTRIIFTNLFGHCYKV